jgi:hypothetical protein
MLRSLYPRGKSSRFLLDRRLGGPQILSGHCGEEKIHEMLGIELRPIARRYTRHLPGVNDENRKKSQSG